MNEFKRKITIDEKADSAYIYLKEIEKGGIANSIPISSDIIFDFDSQGVLVGVEFLSLVLLNLDLLAENFEIVYL
jgi:uncharacterized protein YuzE